MPHRWHISSLLLLQNEETRNEIIALYKANNVQELEKRLSTRIEFGTAGKTNAMCNCSVCVHGWRNGTAGLRARMEAGFSRMNDLTVLQASQGLAIYIEKTVKDAKKRGVVVGHDHRHHSKEFAQLTAATFIQRGFKVWFYKELVHTPLVVSRRWQCRITVPMLIAKSSLTLSKNCMLQVVLWLLPLT